MHPLALNPDLWTLLVNNVEVDVEEKTITTW